MTRIQLARALVRLYPRAWRARYEVELLVLVDDQGASPRIIIDLAVGALRERAAQIVDAYGSAVVDRAIFTRRVLGMRIAIVLVGSALSEILGMALNPRVAPRHYPVYLAGVYLFGSMALLLRTGWLGWAAHRDRRLPLSSRASARFEALGWMCVAVAIGAVSERLTRGGGGIMLMLAFDAFVKQTASHRRWLAAQATR